ncbi:MAG: TonB family protein [Gemmatimonadaceae bacterium]|nr:TonB family protein [Gemmatimonadaceae bacterium]
MMNTLLESRPQKQRSPGTALFSIVLHSVLIFFAIYATARAGIPKDNEQREQKVDFVKVKPAEPPPVEKKPEPPPPPKPKPPKPSEHRPAPLPPAPKVEIAPPKGFQVLEAPVTIPTEIPTVDLSAKVTNEADFSGKGTAGGSSTGTAGSEGTKEGAGAGVDTNRNYAEFEVEQPVSPISGVSVAYPEGLRSSGVEGEVLAEFVVNESGRVEASTFKILSSSNPSFTAAVKAALPRMRFRAAKIGKTNVSQVVQQAFVFKLER